MQVTVSVNGDRFWTKDGKYHRDGDLPAIVYADGTKQWYVNGKRHRDGNLPAVECSTGDKEWWVHGRLHRNFGLPAVHYADGTQKWFENGFYFRANDLPVITKGWEYQEWRDRVGVNHREGGPAIIDSNGFFWMKKGLLHRDNDMPAIIYQNGTRCWFWNGKQHRGNNLPAVEYLNGEKEWWVDGIRVYPSDWTYQKKTPEFTDQECMITFEPITNDSEVCQCSKCYKLILFEALEEWLKRSKTCPHCRTDWTNFVIYQ